MTDERTEQQTLFPYSEDVRIREARPILAKVSVQENGQNGVHQ